MHSVQFLQWNETNLSLTVVARDYDKSVSVLSAFIVDGNKLGMLSADDEGNLQLLQYKPRYFCRVLYCDIQCLTC